MDNTSFQLECKTAELNTVKAKIQELESTNAELRNTNFILGERIKLFEAANKKEVFEKYFPQPDTTNNTNLKPESSAPHHQNCTSSTQHAHRNCCPHNPHYNCCYSPCSHPPSSSHNGPNVSSYPKYLAEQLRQLSSEIKEIKSKIDTTYRKIHQILKIKILTSQSPQLVVKLHRRTTQTLLLAQLSILTLQPIL